MCRLRRPFLYDRYSFVTGKLLPSRGKRVEREHARLAMARAGMRQKERGSPLQRRIRWMAIPNVTAGVRFER
jgi:hypothetical protein